LCAEPRSPAAWPLDHRWQQYDQKRLAVALPYGSPAAVINAWGSGIYDTKRNRYCVHGGGHGDYAGNEWYCFDLAVLTWSRIWGPTPNEFISPPPATIGETYLNGDPRSRHSYDGLEYAPNVDKYFVHGGSLWSGSGGFGRIG